MASLRQEPDDRHAGHYSRREARKTFLLRGDIDGLSVKEKTGLPFASQNDGFMHACGHDCHISMLLTAVMIANSIRDEIPGTIKFIFQPAEEVALGALDMMADGVLDGVDGMFGMHVWSELPADRCRLKRAPDGGHRSV